MRKRLIGLVVLVVSMALLSLPTPKAEAGETASFNITVNVLYTLSVSYNSTDVADYADLGDVTPGGSAVASTGGIRITNDGSGLNETYSLNLTNPSGWTASTAAGADTYVLNAAFDPDGTITWSATNHALTTLPVPSTDTKFAGDQTGVAVPYNAERKLWFQFTPPTRSTLTGTKNISITITAGL